jgi:uncharacterized protein (TIGR00369 family)
VSEEPEILETIRKWLATGKYHEFLGVELVAADLDKQELVLKLPYKDDFERMPESGQWHGGVIATFIDIAGDFVLMLATGRGIPTIDLRIDFVRPAIDTDLTAKARIVRAGRSIGFADIELFNDDGRLIASGRGCYSTLSR